MKARNYRGLVYGCREIEGKEDRTKEDYALVVGIGLKIGINTDDESRADRTEWTAANKQENVSRIEDGTGQ